MPEEKIGEVTNFFAKPMVAAIKLSQNLKVGDTLHIKGASTDMTFQVTSMQINRVATDTATVGEEVGIRTPERARSGDVVFRVIEE